MASYLLPFLLVAVSAIISFDRKVPLKPFLYLLLLLFLVFFVGLRHASVDYFSYEEIFNYVDSYAQLGFPNYNPVGDEKPVESLYALLTLFVKSFGGGFYWFVFFVAFVSISIKFYALKVLSSYFYLSLLLYVAMWMGKDLGQIRNGLASAFLLMSIIYAYEKKPLKFSFLAISSMLIHLAGSLTLFIYFARYFSRLFLMFAVLFSAFFLALFGGYGLILVDQLAGAIGLGSEFRIVRYIDSKYAEGYSVLGGTVLMHLFFSLIFLIFYRKLVVINKYSVILVPVYVYGFSLMLLFSDYGVIFARIKDMFCLPVSVALIPSLVNLFEARSRPFIIFLVVVFAAALFFVNIPSVPYYNIIM